MKKLITSTIVLAAFGLFGFYGSSTTSTPPSANDPNIPICAPTPADGPLPVSFVPPPGPVLVRKDIYTLTPAEINSIKVGIAVMKSLPYSDPTSWIYQASIHGTTRTENLPSWNTCHKAGDEFFFLAWHRMYVYYFERILRAKSGDPNLTLPYWNYQSNAAIPPAYRDNISWNPLYDGSRSSTMNSGGSLSSGINSAIVNSLAQIPYYDFQSFINGPHGSVHIAVGGNMQSVSTAAQDPIFWLHHCNIDRLWEEWLRMCGGRANPTDSPWLNKTYTFFDENGTAVNMKGSEVVNTATQLNYKYDFPPAIVCGLRPPRPVVYKRWKLLISPPVAVNTATGKTIFTKANTNSLTAFNKTQKKFALNFAPIEKADKFIIELNGPKITKLPDGAVEVYLNLPPNEVPDPDSKSFVGLVDLFEASHQAHHGASAPIEIDATRAANQLGLKIDNFQKAQITFFVRGNNLNGKEVQTTSDITFENVTLAVERPEANQ